MPAWKDSLEAVRQGASGLRRHLPTPGAATLGGGGQQVMEGVTGGVVGGGAVGGMGGMGGKLGAFMKNPSVKMMGPAFLVMLLEALIGGKMDQIHGLMGQGIQQRGVEQMGEAAADPQAAYYQAMLPQYEQQEEMSRSMLMQTIMGGGGVLAEGQEMHGGV